jgi:hypothetical protein
MKVTDRFPISAFPAVICFLTGLLTFNGELGSLRRVTLPAVRHGQTSKIQSGCGPCGNILTIPTVFPPGCHLFPVGKLRAT